MGSAARLHVAETGVWDRKVEQLEALYDELLPTARTGGAGAPERRVVAP